MSKKRTILAIIAVVALVAILAVCFVACTKDDGSQQSYKKRLEKAGYEVGLYENEDLQEIADSMGCGVPVWALEATKQYGASQDMVTIINFKNAEDATIYYNVSKRFVEGREDLDIYMNGSLVMVGTQQGLKDAK